MAFQVSPGVNITEIDQTTSAPAVATTEGAIAGAFRWGPMNQRVLIDSEGSLAATFGKPTSFNAETFFTASSFLAYGNKLYVVRAGNTSYLATDPAKSATANTLAINANYANGSSNSSLYPTAVGANATLQAAYIAQIASVQSTDDYEDAATNLSDNPGVHFSARYPGSIGNSLKVSVCQSAAAWESSVDATVEVASGIAAVGDDVFSSFGNTATTTDGSGTGGQVRVTAYANGDYAIAAIAAVGSGYANGDTLTVLGSLLGGADTTNDLTADITTDGSGGIASLASVSGVSALSTAGDDAEFSIAVGESTGYISIPQVIAAAPLANTDLSIFTDVEAAFLVGDLLVVGNNTIGTAILKLKSFGAPEANATHTRLPVNFENKYQQRATFTATSVTRRWEHYNLVDKAPTSTITMLNLDRRDANNVLIKDGLHIVVSDEDGVVSGVPGTILEVYNNLSKATDAKTEEGDDNYYRNVLRDNSQWIWAFNDVSGVTSGLASAVTTSAATLPVTMSFVGGDDGEDEATLAEGTIMAAYDQFRNAEEVDVSLILAGKARGGTNGELIANYIIGNVVEQRLDCLAYISPAKADVVNAGVAAADNVVGFRNSLTNSSYAVMDSGYKYMYDRYNDVYRWVPLNGDIAGLAVRTDETRDPWFSPAGLQRGGIRNIVKLSWNPTKGDRDKIYKADINPVVTLPGQGTVLFGDKTLLGRPSPFDRINVRRLFIVLEKTVATAAKFTLFEFNDEFTRAQFKNLVEPFLRDVQGRRGIYDFRVVCDESNNTQAVIDGNQFVGDIYIKPARSINFIQLNFVAVRSGVEFSEIVGAE